MMMQMGQNEATEVMQDGFQLNVSVTDEALIAYYAPQYRQETISFYEGTWSASRCQQCGYIFEQLILKLMQA